MSSRGSHGSKERRPGLAAPDRGFLTDFGIFPTGYPTMLTPAPPDGAASPETVSPVIQLSVLRLDVGLFIGVRDPRAGTPHWSTRGRSADAENGRGVVIVDVLSAGTWMVRREYDKTVCVLVMGDIPGGRPARRWMRRPPNRDPAHL